MTPRDHRSTCRHGNHTGSLCMVVDHAGSILQRIQPTTPCSAEAGHQQLTVWLYGCSCTSSGAMYSGVPLMDVSTMVLQLMARAKPKSHSFTAPFAPIRMFWGFMSLKATRRKKHGHIAARGSAQRVVFTLPYTSVACSGYMNCRTALGRNLLHHLGGLVCRADAS